MSNPGIWSCEDDAERRGRHSHAGRGNEFASAEGESTGRPEHWQSQWHPAKTTRGVAEGIPTGGAGTSFNPDVVPSNQQPFAADQVVRVGSNSETGQSAT
jgi:hypothetical protein